jgi:5-amino-6-(D-ribitylamino)uracil---L-tyrosine 4-hydroxyphenyl transferase
MDTSRTLREVLQGRALSSEELYFLLSQGDKNQVLNCANELNLALHGHRVTFVHNRNINYTNICINHCGFCAFRRDGDEEGSYFLTVEEILEEIKKTPTVREVCIQGGLSPDLRFSYVVEMLRAIKSQFPHIHIHAFSPMEVYYFSQKSGKSLVSTLECLIQNGLDSLPGTAAEVLDDRLRKKICPEKIGTSTWVEVIKTAHRMGLRSTATVLFGHIETPKQLVDHLVLLREIQGEKHGFTELIPLPFVPFQTPLGRKAGVNGPLSFGRQRHFYALCRIFFHHSIPNLQASWPKLGLDQALACTFSGVNDLGGTLYQENITRCAGGIHGEKVTLGDFERRILDAGKIPQLRNTLYQFLDHGSLPSSLREEGYEPSGDFTEKGKRGLTISFTSNKHTADIPTPKRQSSRIG